MTFTTAFLSLVVALTVPLSAAITPAILPFVVAGFVAPGLARLALFTGVARIGAARSSSLVGTAPLFAVLMAMLFLGERPSPVLLAGVALIVAGGGLLARRGLAEGPWRRCDMVFPVLAAAAFALRDVISRRGLQAYGEPLVAAGAATATSLVVMWCLAGLVPLPWTLRVRPVGLAFLLLTGLAEGLAYLAMWRALALGEVSLVSPLVNAHPIFAVTLAALFLRDLERVTWRIAGAAALIIAGVALVVRFGTG